MTVLADTSALYALLDRSDANHAAAAETWSSLARTESVLVHSFAIVETSALVQRRLGTAALRGLHDDLLLPVSIVQVDAAMYRSAVTALLAAQSHTLSLVDFTSFELMRALHISTAFAFDADFTRYGFATLPS